MQERREEVHLGKHTHTQHTQTRTQRRRTYLFSFEWNGVSEWRCDQRKRGRERGVRADANAPTHAEVRYSMRLNVSFFFRKEKNHSARCLFRVVREIPLSFLFSFEPFVYLFSVSGFCCSPSSLVEEGLVVPVRAETSKETKKGEKATTVAFSPDLFFSFAPFL